MTPSDCQRLGDLLDLYAAGECDPASARDVQAHLDVCPRCRESLRQSRQLLGLLDLRHREEEALSRLQTALRRQARRDAPTHLRFVGRLTALAALLLVCLSMGLWFQPGAGSFPVGLAVSPTPRDAAVEMVPAPHKLSRGKDAESSPRLPPLVGVRLTFTNPASRTLYVRLGDDAFACRLDLSGPVLRLPAGGGRPFVPITPTTLTIPPGGRASVAWERLAEVEGRQVYYLYPRTPGEHTLTVRLRVRAWHDGEFPRTVWLRPAAGVRVNVPGGE